MEEYKIDDLSDKELKWGYWFISHKEELKKYGAYLLALVCLLIWIKPVWGLVVYLSELPQDQAIIMSLTRPGIDFSALREKSRVEELRITPARAIYTGDNQYDFLAQATNLNLNRGVAELKYRFVSGAFVSPTGTIAILPNRTVYLLSLANQSPIRLSSPVLEIISLRWQSIRQRLESSENPIVISQPTFGPNEDNSRFLINFLAKNESLKNIWEVRFQGILFAGNNIVSVNQITMEEFISGQSREVEISWFERLPGVSRVEVIPVVDVFDENNFFEISSQAIDF